MASIAPPHRPTKGAPPSEARASVNLTKAEPATLKPLNFRVPADFHRDFKSYAVLHDMKMLDLLRLCYEEYKQRHI